MAHIPWFLVIAVVLIIILGIALFMVLGRRMGVQASKEDASIIKKSLMNRIAQKDARKAGALVMPPPLPKNISSSETIEAVSYVQPETGTDLALRLFEVQKRVTQFHAETFLKQVDGCFRNIVIGFSEGNRANLSPVLTEKLLAIFDEEIEKRLTNGYSAYCEIRRLERLEIKDIILSEEEIEIQVAITSWQVSYQMNREKRLIEGTEGLTEFCDLWTFTQSEKEPTWLLKKTEAF